MLTVINGSNAIRETTNERRSAANSESRIIMFPNDPAQRRLAGKMPVDSVETKLEGGSDAIKDEEELHLLLEATLGKEQARWHRAGIQIVIGVNFGLRIGDLVKLRWKDLFEASIEDTGRPERWEVRDRVIIREEKSQKTRALYPNAAVRQALQWFKREEADRRDCSLDINEYLFIGDKNKRYVTNEAEGAVKLFVQCPMYESSVRDDLKIVLEECEIEHRVTPHSFRKTFGYFMGQLTGTSEAYSNRSTSVVQKIFNHSDQRVTLRYTGLDIEEIRGYYEELNLGIAVVEKHCR